MQGKGKGKEMAKSMSDRGELGSLRVQQYSYFKILSFCDVSKDKCTVLTTNYIILSNMQRLDSVEVKMMQMTTGMTLVMSS